MINETCKSLFNDSKLMNESMINVTVELEPSRLAERMAKETLRELQRLAPYAGYQPIADLDEGSILKYFNTLTWLRCGIATGDTRSFASYRKLFKQLAIPVMVYQTLIPIGIAIDRDYSLRFIPAYSINSDNLLDPETLMTLSDIFTSMEASGFKVVYGLPRDPQGELDFMALCSVEGVVKSYRKAHPVYGFLASFFEQKKLNEVTGAMCRIIYGYETDYETYVSAMFRRLSDGKPPRKTETTE